MVRENDRARRAGIVARLWTTGLLITCVMLAPALRPAAAAGSPVAIIVNSETPVEELSLAEVRKILLGDRQFWKTNIRVVLLVRAPVARERTVVLKTIYQMSEAQFRQYWIAKIFRAETTSGPKIVYSDQMTSELVSAIPGSIGFVDASNIQPGVKVLRVDGKLPGEKGYPLQ